ncbi:MAG TPA: META domain-containing protein [Vicinamibacterales bacterium]|jgi:heat shock protein HslJ
MRAFPFVVLLAVLAAGCDDNPLKPSDIKEVTWKLETIERAGVPTITVPSPDQYTLRLGNDGRLNVRADCNQCSGTYSLEGNTLKVGNVACTLIGCPAGSLDGTYAAALGGSSSVAISDSHLILRNGMVTLRFRN